jgi:hypothetical protein
VNLFDPANEARIPKDLPVYVISGEMDPAGGNNGVLALANRLHFIYSTGLPRQHPA